jgi:general secretion pathway protein N
MSRHRLLVYLLLGAAVYAAVLVATFPAAWVAHMVGMASDRKLALRDAAGTAWSGSGRLYARQRAGGLVDLGNVRWQASPIALVRGKLGAELVLGEAGRTMRVEASPATLVLRDIDVEFPGSLLVGFAPALGPLGPVGTVRVRSDSFRIDGDSVLGLAEIEWRALRLTRAQDVELGSHVARLRGAGARVDIELATVDGPLQVSGGGTWTRASGLTLSGRAEPRGAAVASFLKAVCAEYRDSRCHFRYSGV